MISFNLWTRRTKRRRRLNIWCRWKWKNNKEVKQRRHWKKIRVQYNKKTVFNLLPRGVRVIEWLGAISADWVDVDNKPIDAADNTSCREESVVTALRNFFTFFLQRLPDHRWCPISSPSRSSWGASPCRAANPWRPGKQHKFLLF